MPAFLLANLNQRRNTYRILSAEQGGLYGPKIGGAWWKDVGSVYVMVVPLNDGQHVVFKAKKTETLTISESTGDSSLAKALHVPGCAKPRNPMLVFSLS